MKIRVVTDSDVPLDVLVKNTKNTNIKVKKLRRNLVVKGQKATYSRVIANLEDLNINRIKITIQGPKEWLLCFFEIEKEKLQQLQKELKGCIGQTELLELLKKVGLNKEEEQIIIKRYGIENLEVDRICSDLGISNSTYKRIRRAALTKIARYLCNYNEN